MMKQIINLFWLLLLTGFISLPETTCGQTKAQIEGVDFYVHNDTLFVRYDLVKAKNDEWFDVTMTIRTSSGKTYNPVSVSGHVGKFIAGGKNKQITWALLKDNVFIDEEITVELSALPMGTPRAEDQIRTEEQVKVEKQPEYATTKPREIVSRTYSKGGAIALSAIVPGWGITKQKEGGAYWLIGVGFYGVVAGGVALNISANSAYKKYKDATTASERDDLYTKARNQAKIGNILYYTAAGIWVLDMVWTILTPNKIKSSFSVHGIYNPEFKQPMISLTYKF